MGNFLNLVYDGIDVTKDNINVYFESYLQFEDYKVFDINHIPNNGEKYYYFFEYRYYLTVFIATEKNCSWNSIRTERYINQDPENDLDKIHFLLQINFFI